METTGLFAYDPSKYNKVILVKDRIGYDELVDRVYMYMGLDRDVFNLNLWFRKSVVLGTFVRLQLGCDNDIDMIYHMKALSLQLAYEIYIEVEPQFR